MILVSYCSYIETSSFALRSASSWVTKSPFKSLRSLIFAFISFFLSSTWRCLNSYVFILACRSLS